MLGIVGCDIAAGVLGQHFKSPLHFADGPFERVDGFLHIGNDGRQEMRDAIQERQLHALGVHHDEPQRFSSILIQQAHDNGIDTHSFSRARCPCDQEMRHARQIRDPDFATDVFSQSEHHVMRAARKFCAFEQLFAGDERGLLVWHFNPDQRFSGNWRFNADGMRGQGQCQIV